MKLREWQKKRGIPHKKNFNSFLSNNFFKTQRIASQEITIVWLFVCLCENLAESRKFHLFVCHSVEILRKD